jgi:peptide-methionine (S)-S-oxide reductase
MIWQLSLNIRLAKRHDARSEILDERRRPGHGNRCCGKPGNWQVRAFFHANATGHAEVVQITFDPAQVSYPELLEVFFKTHDPTTMNRQGNDSGTQYRSVVFYHDEAQREVAEKIKNELEKSGAFRAPIVTEISPFAKFYPAEDYHQNYFTRNPGQGYCAAIIRPKMDKFRDAFSKKLVHRVSEKMK